MAAALARSRSLLLIALLAAFGTAKVTTGDYVSGENVTNWKYLDRFCFDKMGGKLSIVASTIPDYEFTELALYHDVEHEGFPLVYESGRSCEWKRAQAARLVKLNNPSLATEGRTFNMKNSIPRWWYVVALNCAQEQVAVHDYVFTFTNGDEGKFTYQFSYDQQGIFQWTIFICFALLALIPLTVWSYRKQRAAGESSAHMFLGLLCAVEVVVFCSVVLVLIHEDIYSRNGVGLPGLVQFAYILQLFPDVGMCSLFILIAKGWIVSSNTIQRSDLRTVMEIVVTYLACEIALLLWEFGTTDPAEHFYMYQGIEGVLLCVLRVFLMLYFVGCCVQSASGYPRVSDKRVFYERFMVYGAAYFAVVPVCVIIANYSNSYSVRSITTIIEMVANVVFYYIFWAFFTFDSKYIKKNPADQSVNIHLRSRQANLGGYTSANQADDDGLMMDDIGVDDVDTAVEGDSSDDSSDKETGAI